MVEISAPARAGHYLVYKCIYIYILYYVIYMLATNQNVRGPQARSTPRASCWRTRRHPGLPSNPP